MICLPKNSAVRRFVFRVVASVSANIVLTIFVASCFDEFHPHGPLAYLLAVLPAVAILGYIVALGLFLVEEKDEFQRNVFIQTLLCGIGGTLVFMEVWGSLETYMHIRHFPTTWTFTLFWIFCGISSPLLLRRYR